MTDGPQPTEPAATEDQPAEPRAFGDAMSGDLMAQLRADVEARVRPMLEPQPDPRLADLSEADQDVLAETQRTYQERLEELELRNQLLEMSRDRPREARIIERLLQAGTLADMAEALSAAFGEQDPEAQVAEVDRNNPPMTAASAHSWQDMIRLPDGQMITREAGLEILRNAESLHG